MGKYRKYPPGFKATGYSLVRKDLNRIRREAYKLDKEIEDILVYLFS